MLYYEALRRSDQFSWVVFIHGAGGSIQTWKFQRKAFAGLANLLFIDLRDHGKSQHMPFRRNYDFEMVSNEILEILDHEKIKSAVFISLSFGSVLLQDLAIRSPGRIKGAILAGAIFRANWKIRTFIHSARIMNLFLPYRQMYSLFSYLLMPKAQHQFSRRIYRMQARKIKPEAYMRWIGLYDEFFQLLDRFWNQPLPFPAMVVMGEQDFVFLTAARSFSACRENVSLQLISGAGHICNIDKPAVFNQISIEFIKSADLLTVEKNLSEN